MDRAADKIRVRFLGERQSKTLLIVRIGEVVEVGGDGNVLINDGLVPATTWDKIADPAAHFAGWAYSIEPQHWSMLGVLMRPFVVNKRSCPSWAVSSPVELDLLEGSIFYRDAAFLQVAYVSGDGFLEVQVGTTASRPIVLQMVDGEPVNRADVLSSSRTGWLIGQAEFVEWLKSGVRPDAARELNRGTSSCDGLMRMLLPEPPDQGEVSS